MPNWVTNKLFIAGPGADREMFHDGLIRDDDPEGNHNYRILQTYVPVSLDAQVDEQNLRWGVKWGDCETEQIPTAELKATDSFGAMLTGYLFDTPWGTATHGFLALSNAWPTLTFSVGSIEEGPSFARVEVFRAGRRMTCEDFDVSDMPDFDDEDPDAESDPNDEWRDELAEAVYGSALSRALRVAKLGPVRV